MFLKGVVKLVVGCGVFILIWWLWCFFLLYGVVVFYGNCVLLIYEIIFVFFFWGLGFRVYGILVWVEWFMLNSWEVEVILMWDLDFVYFFLSRCSLCFE